MRWNKMENELALRWFSSGLKNHIRSYDCAPKS